MSKNSKGKEPEHLWSNISEDDFINEENIVDVDLGPFNKDAMTKYAVNVNMCRQIVKLSDSLKPVERRILYSMYLEGAMGRNVKSVVIIGTTSTYHSHGDGSIYQTYVRMAQSWKKACPLINGKGNFGNAVQSDMYAHFRYTEGELSKYAQECFFDDYDADCVETIFNSACDKFEPMSLPAKFPNILINGGMGIAIGNSFRIPPFNIHDIIDNCKKVLLDSETTDVFMYPDLPTGCAIVDDGESLQSIINNGTGTLRMRANIDIIDRGKVWVLQITDVPWMVGLDTVVAKLTSLTKAGKLFIKDIQDASYTVKGQFGIETKIKMNIILDKAHDPQAILNKIYSLTDLDKSVAVNFKVVTENLTVEKMSMRDLIQSWIDERRSYKRRLLMKRMVKINARISLLGILIHLLEDDNINTTLNVIKNTVSSELVEKLMTLASMNSYQAKRIGEMKLSAFTKDAQDRYKDELFNLECELSQLYITTRSDSKIDRIILDELDALKKYAQPRRSRLVSLSSKRYIPDSDFNIIISKQGYVKKLPVTVDTKIVYGSFKNGDFPISRRVVNNLKSLMIFDSFGRYTQMPLFDIENNEPSHYGHKVYDIAKLSGSIVSVVEPIEGDKLEATMKDMGRLYLVTATKQGYVKKTLLEDFQKIKNTKNIKCMKIRDDDALVYADIIGENEDLVFYSKKGEFVFINMASISEQGKDSMGTSVLKLEADDNLLGMTIIYENSEYIGVVTSKGNVKKCESKYLGKITRRNASNGQSYICTLDSGDSIESIVEMRESDGLTIITRSGVTRLESDDIPVMMKKSKGKKLIPVPNGQSILSICVK